MPKIRVCIEDIEHMLAERKRINSAKLADLEFVQADEVVAVDATLLRHWQETGLHNIDFIEMHFLRKEKVAKNG